MSLVRACRLDEVPADEGLAVLVDETAVVVTRDGDEVFALQDLCSHAAVALSEGEVAGGVIECWLHGSCFDLRSGKPTGPPAIAPVSTFPVEVRDGEVWVDVTTTLNGVTPS
ncbi:Anthranilate 1,2-dioxygenase ferredoxin subunit [Nocardioides dokdonensis FR1436]|uniref:Anthranilate 1,2-dioxygenase ferredoxin subunit n=1 Tax=Nocardioides dokdonensis FR1436 TaxID=1300347 RepID=A0A1A9GQ82_9ACTN|nr:non-heme iron oxygenase ferredoxin subunit [Nocardioides dokdonensis]ANH39820.1 Anthranilate 1,2-dioxygenase ferredoxin subunit [Nocardioides dokdonensis FR1436]